MSLACHDLRTPLATVHGFARTIEQHELPDDRARHYVGLMATASVEMADLLDRLSLVARIERGSYEPVLQGVDSLELARAAAEEVRGGNAAAHGQGAPVLTDREWLGRSLSALAECALRHGDANGVEIAVSGVELRLSPVTGAAGPILLGEELRDFGAEAARRLVEALGGSLSLDGQSLLVRLPAT